MLVLTQLGIGTLLAERLLLATSSHWVQLISSAMGFGIGMFGMTCAILHLGRPLYAYRAFLGWRTSWLSREIIAFNGFAAAVHLHIVNVALQNNLIPAFILDRIPLAIPTLPLWATGWAAALTGLVGVLCSMMIYIDTKRPCWNLKITATKFGLTAVLLGLAATLVALCGGALLGQSPINPNALMLVSLMLIGVTVGKLAFELTHLTYNTKALPQVLAARVGLAVTGGIALPLLMLLLSSLPNTLILAAVAGMIFATLTLGELAERFLYFAAADALRMPGIPIHSDGGHH
jgi:DMSO reductase anchor subunit